MKFRKTIAQILSMVMLISTFAFLGGAKLSDEQTLLAEQIGYELLNAEKTEEQYKQEVYSYDLKGLDGQEDFILIMGQDCGYAIFSKENLNLIEYSPYGNSPYEDLDKSQARYAGPASYFVKDDLGVKNLITNEVVEEARLSDIAEQVRAVAKIGKVETPIEKPIVKEEISLQSVETTITEDQIVEETIEDVVAQDPIIDENVDLGDEQGAEVTSSDKGNADVEEVEAFEWINRKLISDYQYFILELAVEPNGVEDGVCTGVALQLLLSYNGWSKYGKLIDEKFWERSYEADADRYKPYEQYNRQTTTSTSSNVTGQTFFEYLSSKIYPSGTQNGASLTQAKYAMADYFDEFLTDEEKNMIYVDHHESSAFIAEKIKSEIDADRPLIVRITSYNAQDEEIGPHMVVVYGYQTFIINGVQTEGYIAHFGYMENKYRYCWFDKSWLLKSYLTLHIDHMHQDEIVSNGQVPAGNTHIVECTTCGRVSTTDEHAISYHNYSFDNSVRQASHLIKCDICEYKTLEQHDYRWMPTTTRTHAFKCLICDYVKKDEDGVDMSGAHEQAYSTGDECWICGYGDSTIILPTSINDVSHNNEN